jgi:RHS repeat-associated protein
MNRTLGSPVVTSRRRRVLALILSTALVVSLAPADANATATAQPPGRAPTTAAGTTPMAPTPGDPAPMVDPPGGPASYAYDAIGRLVGVSQPGGQTASYSYDPAGNVTAVRRFASTTLSVLSVVPVAAPAGTRVTISGTAFSTTPANNRVTFNGVNATVVTASATTLTVDVPTATATGPLRVVVGAASAAGGTFTVTPGAPVISAMNPTSGPATTEVTLTGQGFDTVVGNNVVTLGGQAVEVLSATATSLKFRVPVAAAGGRVTVMNVRGSGNAPQDFFVPPAGVDPGKVESVTRVALGATSTIRVNTPGNVAVVLFDAPAGRIASAGFTASTFTGAVEARAVAPDGASIPDGSDWDSQPFDLDLADLRPRQTYQIVIDPRDDTDRGQVAVTLSEPLRTDLDPNAAGSVQSVTLPGQDIRLAFEGPAGQAASLGFSDNTLPQSAYVDVTGPLGEGLRSDWSLSPESADSIDVEALPTAGRYEIVIDPRHSAVGRLTVTYSLRANAATITKGGAAVTATVTRLGQDAAMSFDATAGQAIAFGFTDNTLTTATYLTILAPDGSILVDHAYLSQGSSDNVRMANPPATGRYRLVISPREVGTGRLTVTYSGRVDGGTVAKGGPALTVDMTRPGQNAVVRFDGTAGDAIGFGFNANTISKTSHVTVLAPDGSTLVNREYLGAGSDGNVRVDRLPATGGYQLLIDPSEVATGRVTITYSARVDAGVATKTGTAVTATIGRAGQDAAVSFDVAANDVLSVAVTTNTLTEIAYLRVIAPDGTQVGDRELVSVGRVADVDLPKLTVAGRYRLLVQPWDAGTGAVSVLLSQEVAGGALTVGGSGRAATIGRAGQNARYTFTGTAGQRLLTNVSANTLPVTYATLYGPTGADLGRVRLSGTTGGNLPDLPAAGAYALVLDREDVGTGAITVALATRPATARAATAQTPKALKNALAADTRLVAPPAKAPAPASANGPQAWTPDTDSLRGVDWNARRPRVAQPAPLAAPPGVTALAGHTLKIDGTPLAGAKVTIGATTARTDGQGRFLLTGLSAGDQTMVVDGGAASTPADQYGVFHIKVTVSAGRTTVLPYTVWMQRLDTEHVVRFPSPNPSEVVLTTPKVPGLEVRIPAGSVVRDAAGNVVTELGITPIPIDRSPFPLPKDGIVPVYFTVQPGGTYTFPDGARIIYPNYTKLPPHTRVDFWNYDPEHKGWYVYGKGSVSADGRQVVPNADTKVWAFHGAMFNAGNLPPWLTSAFDDLADWLDGDPVDLSTGMMTDAHTDLVVEDTMPLALTRHFWQGDDKEREFGVGQVSNYGMFLHSEQQYEQVDLYIPGGGKVHYVRTSPGTSFSDAVFGARETAGEYRGSVIAFKSDPALGGSRGWVLTRRDGMVFVFPMYSPLVAIRDRNGNQVTMTRRSDDRLEQVTSPNGRWIKFEYDAEDRVSAARDSLGRTVRYTYTGRRLTTVVNPAGKSMVYAFDTLDRLSGLTDARGIRYVINEYDPISGRIARQRVPEGGVFTFAYNTDAQGKVTETRVTQPGGSVRRVTFNAVGAVTSDTAANGTALAKTTTYERRADQQLAAFTDSSGRRTVYNYDGENRLVSTTVLAGTPDAATGGTLTFGGPFDQPLRHTDQNGKVTSYTYEPDGDVATVTDPANRTTTFTYNEAGLPLTVTDPGNRTTTYAYRGGDLVSVTDPLGRVTRQFTDNAGRPLAIIDPMGAITRLSYDALNQVTSVTDALGQVTSFTYDDNGNLATLTGPRQNTTTWTYDNRDRLVSVKDPLNRTATRAYAANGRIQRSTSRAGKVTTFEYDALYRTTKLNYGVNGSAVESSVTVAYDAVGRLERLTDTATSAPTSYGYDNRDRLTAIRAPLEKITYGYDAADRRTSMTVPMQPAVSYEYDAAGALKKVTQGTQVAETTAFDAAGRPATVALPGGWSRVASYNTAGEVTGLTFRHGGADKGTITYTYDQAGRVTSTTGSMARVTVPAERTALTYDAANRLTSAGGRALTYDLDGNLTNDGTNTYTWNARGQLTGANRTGLAASFAYDGLGQRNNYIVGGNQTRFLDDSHTPVRVFAADADSATLLSSGVDQWLTRTDAAGQRTFLTDIAGSVIGLGDTAGAVRTQYAYDPFGGGAAGGDASTNPIGFTGRENDPTGLMYYRARYYSPTLQRFISEDPISFEGGDNLYAYAADSPTNYTDPSGNNPILVGCLVGGLTDGAMEYLSQRLSGRKVDWGWGGVGGAAALGCAMGAVAGFLKGARAVSCAANSFTPDTLVVMADGSRRRIADIRAGDRVLAAPESDPDAAPTAATVTTVITGTGEKHLVDISVNGGAPITATDGHPFWLPHEQRWADAGTLAPGQWLRTSAGTYVQITAVNRRTAYERVHNLTVDDLHTFYVVAAGSPVLVHNTNCIPAKGNYRDLFRQQNPQMPKDWQVHHALPQKYADTMAQVGVNVHENRFLRGVESTVHTQVTNEWGRFGRNLGRPPTADEITKFSYYIDEKYGQYFIFGQ